MRKVPLQGAKGKGLYALIDDEDLPKVAKYNWHLTSGGYAACVTHRAGTKRGEQGRSINVSMHRLLMGFPEGQVDHVSRDRLDNQKANLRLASHTENTWNSQKKVGASGFIGVRQESANVWSARLGSVPIGFYPTAVAAAQARDLAALQQRNEFSVLNFPESVLPSSVTPLPLRNIGERTSKVVGVSFSKTRKAKEKWRCVWKKKHLGWYITEQQAVDALQKVKNESQVC